MAKTQEYQKLYGLVTLCAVDTHQKPENNSSESEADAVQRTHILYGSQYGAQSDRYTGVPDGRGCSDTWTPHL